MPARIDRSFWGERYSGTTGTQLMAALRFLDLIDSSSFPTLKLRQLVVSRDAQRAEILKNITLEAYSFIYGRIDPQTATYAQMEEAFRDDYQIASDVARKCIKFFIGISGGGGMNISPFISRKNKVPRPVTTSKKNTKTPTKKIGMEVPNSELNEVKQIPNGIGVDKILLDKFPELDPAWTDEIKVKWFEAFDELLRRTGSSS
ncbi:MAG: hypothetical protein FWH42_04630 [Dehalococcoidia bacterium]|nr:hypothetical protein [Dehalococcoidia bacterium]